MQPFASGRDAFINFTEEQPVAAAPGVTQVGGTVTVDISSLPDTSATLVFRLINNDQDENTTVHIETVDVFGADVPPQISAGLVNDTAPDGPGTDIFHTDGLTNDPAITGAVTDDIGISRLEAQVDSGVYQDILPLLSGEQFHFDPGTLAAGPHRVTIRVTDTSGQVAQAFIDFRMNQPPVARAGRRRHHQRRRDGCLRRQSIIGRRSAVVRPVVAVRRWHDGRGAARVAQLRSRRRLHRHAHGRGYGGKHSQRHCAITVSNCRRKSCGSTIRPASRANPLIWWRRFATPAARHALGDNRVGRWRQRTGRHQ